MSIVLIGGHDRMHSEYMGICSKRGHHLKVYTQMPARFEKVIGKPDGIVLFTSTVSHKMINIAVKKAKREKIPLLRSHNSSGTSLNGLVHELEALTVDS